MRDKLLSIAQSIRPPAICVLCNQFHKRTLALCDFCIQLLPALENACRQCAYPLADPTYPLCGHCIKTPPSFDAATIAYRFEEPLRSIVHQFKYKDGLFLGSLLTELIIKAWEKNPTHPQCLIPVPMHPKKLKQRGFNQAVILTRLLSKRLGLPKDLNSCKKIINTPPQALLDSQKRIQNIKDAFSVNKIPYNHIALVDDLLTTGSTANELAHSLKQFGVERVEIWCCARAVNKSGF